MSTTQLMPLTDPLGTFDQRDIAHLRTQLRACPAVRDAAVALRTDRASGRQLVAYLLANGEPLPLAAVRAQLARTVPAGLMPATFITVDALPRLAGGAPDLAALPAPDGAALGLRQYETPDGPVEKAIALMWQDLLGVEPVGRQAHFFELGGHSALAVELIYRVRRQMAVDVAMRDLFGAPTLQAFAAHVASRIRLPAGQPAALA
ncbi:phosphopantetheine-binding protein [Oxalobacteraceae bacterium OTU3REALA1]|nr:phosphopantetheine-binding protein [Oxalobacteraceae bacterium OTU3REALA1]